MASLTVSDNLTDSFRFGQSDCVRHLDRQCDTRPSVSFGHLAQHRPIDVSYLFPFTDSLQVGHFDSFGQLNPHVPTP